jgi:hypothetical protein
VCGRCAASSAQQRVAARRQGADAARPRGGAGELTSFILYTLGIGTALAMLTSLFNDLAKALGSSQRVFDLIDRSRHPQHAHAPASPVRLFSAARRRRTEPDRARPRRAQRPGDLAAQRRGDPGGGGRGGHAVRRGGGARRGDGDPLRGGALRVPRAPRGARAARTAPRRGARAHSRAGPPPPPPPLSYEVDTPRPSPRTNRTRRVPPLRSGRRGAGSRQSSRSSSASTTPSAGACWSAGRTCAASRGKASCSTSPASCRSPCSLRARSARTSSSGRAPLRAPAPASATRESRPPLVLIGHAATLTPY